MSLSHSLCLAALLQAGPQSPVEPAPSSEPLLARVAVIGASGSAGFGTSARFAEAFEAILRCAHDPILDTAENAMFLGPASSGEAQVERALQMRPTLVVGFDFLFWFGYGEVAAEAERLELLEDGLELLSAFDCPLVLGLLPDMSAAIGTMLAAGQVPKPETLQRLNARLEEWAAKRRRVVLLPLPGLVAAMRADAPVELGGRTWPAGSTRALLQLDHLHPTRTGLVALARLSADLMIERLGADPGLFETDFGAAEQRLQAAVERRRAERLQRLRERKERGREKPGGEGKGL